MIDISLEKDIPTATGNKKIQVELQLEKGKSACLYGASGTGKTTIFRILAGLEPAEAGHITINGTTWYNSAKKIQLKPQERNIGFMFQDYALFPHMTVQENLNYALKKGRNRQIIEELLEIIELKNFKDRKPNTLSGGQQQRVALARSLVNKPELLLLDEPLAALDKGMRIKLQDYIINLQQNFGFSLLLITHNLGEIIKLTSQLYTLEEQFRGPFDPVTHFTGGTVSGKFQIEAELIEIRKEDILVLLSLLSGNKIIKVVIPPDEAKHLQIGDQLLVASKGFNPLIYKI